MKKILALLALLFHGLAWGQTNNFNTLDQALYPVTYGTSGYCWTSNGTSAIPSWQACSGGGGGGGVGYSFITLTGASASTKTYTLPNVTTTILTATPTFTGLSLFSGTGASSAYAGTSCTNQFPRSLSASGAATCASVALATDVSGTLANSSTTATATNTVSSIVLRDSSGNFTAGTITASLTGTAATATTAANALLLNGATFAAPGPIGSTTPSSGAHTTISATGQITSTVAQGTAPLVVTSTSVVTNLNVGLLGGATFAAPGAIGGTTPAAITGTTITGNGFVPNSASVPTNGLYLPAANTVALSAGSGNRFQCGTATCTAAGDLTVTGNLSGANLIAFTASSGTSGGIPYFSTSTQLSTTTLLTANLPVIGGGAGVAPSVGTRSGNTTAYVTTTGSQTSGNVVTIDSNGNHIASGYAQVTSTSVNTFSGKIYTMPVVSTQTVAACNTATPTFTMSSGNMILCTFGTANITTPTFTTSGLTGGSMAIKLVQASPARTFTWPNGNGTSTLKVKWPGGTAPTLSTGNAAEDTVSCNIFSEFIYHCVWAGNFQ